MMFSKCFQAGLVLVLLLVSCSKQEKKAAGVIESAAQLNSPEFRIGLPTGAAAMSVGERLFPKAKRVYVNSHSDAYVAVSSGKIDAYLYDRHCLEYIIKQHPELGLLPEKIADENIVIGITPSRPELLPLVMHLLTSIALMAPIRACTIAGSPGTIPKCRSLTCQRRRP